MRFNVRSILCAAGLALSAAPAIAADFTSFVVMGPDGAPVARVITDAATCPTIKVDGRDGPMTVRAAPGTMPLRPTISKPADSKPSAFPVLTCEAVLPATAKAVSVANRPLPMPPPQVNRIVVIGDTGCRIKGAEVQACNDAAAFPFATIAERAAAWKPDMVLHVGDYLYRETPCPESNKGCAGSPWGYGWDSWDADFFRPGQALLRAAPWIMVRGNHENCARAGQGWWRFVDPHPLTASRDCADAVNDLAGDDSATFAVPLGGGAQVVVMDMAYASEGKALDPSDPAAAPIAAAYQALDQLSGKAAFTIATTHKPILGFSASEKDGVVKIRPGNKAIQSVFAAANLGIMPSGVDVILSGHVHLWQQVSFASLHPSQFIAGFSGTEEDKVPMPEPLPLDAHPAPGASPERFSSWVNGFGYMTMERIDTRHWDVKVWNLAGEIVNTCRIDARHSSCDKAVVH